MKEGKSPRLAKVLGGSVLLAAVMVGGCGGVMPGTCLDGGYRCPGANGDGAGAAQSARQAAERAERAAEEARQAAQRARQAAEKAGNIFDQGMQK
jgi:hypothetical protein